MNLSDVITHSCSNVNNFGPKHMGKLHFSVLHVLGFSPLRNLCFLISITALYKELQFNLIHEISHEYMNILFTDF